MSSSAAKLDCPRVTAISPSIRLIRHATGTLLRGPLGYMPATRHSDPYSAVSREVWKAQYLSP